MNQLVLLNDKEKLNTHIKKETNNYVCLFSLVLSCFWISPITHMRQRTCEMRMFGYNQVTFFFPILFLRNLSEPLDYQYFIHHSLGLLY